MQWDVFCRVVDNFGDVGVCWRLCADLASRGESVRLWVDDATALAWMAPHGTAGVSVHRWDDAAGDVHPGEVVIEAFGCQLPDAFVERMARASNAASAMSEQARTCEPEKLEALVSQWRKVSEDISDEVGKLPGDVARLPSLPALLQDYANALRDALAAVERCRSDAGHQGPENGLSPAAEAFVWVASLSTYPQNRPDQVIQQLKNGGLDLMKALKHPLFHVPADIRDINEYLDQAHIEPKIR